MSLVLKYTSKTVVVLVLLCLLLIAQPRGARAEEPGPLKFSKFTLQTTEPVKVPVSHESWGYENRPVAFSQAGGHPGSWTTLIEFETFNVFNSFLERMIPSPTRDPKDVIVDLPPGFLGNPTAVPRCPLKQALGRVEACPSSTQVGYVVIHFEKGAGFVGALVNVTPEAGQSAEFAIETTAKFSSLLTGHLIHEEGGYGLAVASNDILAANITSVEVTVWGVPGASEHDPLRGLFCSRNQDNNLQAFKEYGDSIWECGSSYGKLSGRGGEKGNGSEVPFLTWPSNCAAGPELGTIRADSWEEPGVYTSRSTAIAGATGCNLLQFDPSIEVKPDTVLADSPVSLEVGLKVPQPEEAGRLSTPELRSSTVTLPEGMSVSSGIIDGIKACNESGPEGINFTGPESEEVGLNGELQLAAGHCPNASTVGTAEAVTPLLAEPVKGHIYLARPGCGEGLPPCTEQDALDGNLYKLYLELGGTGPLASTGIHIKLPGVTEANLATGQLTTTFEGFLEGNPPKFDGLPQMPVSELKVHLNGGPRAPIDNPAECGPATTTADLAPWSAPGTTPEGVQVAGLPDATPLSFFDVEGCANRRGLAPGFLAGTVTPNAGRFSAFTMNISRNDGEQFIKGVQVHTPPGLLGVLANVPLCGEAEADDGHCPEGSKIGTTRVATGAGSHPFEIEGSIYLTGPYDGAPFGLSIVTHAVAGPFDLGLVVVRARIDVDPEDSTLTVTTDETGPYALPQIVFGVPLRLKRITVDVNRPDFMFNPTNCAAQRIEAVISGNQQAKTTVESPFAVGGCKTLAFKPGFTASTAGNTSRVKGASLDTKLSYPKGALGNDTNIAQVKVSLPKQLPSRLSTLQQACTARQFAANPAGCPRASIIGVVRAKTPLLPVGLSGPVYFVSHGGEAFPSLVIVLEGDNVRVDLTGATFINEKTNVTSSTFRTIPDVPVDTFELYLPQGKFSALAARGSLCRLQGKLKMPAEFVAQNGAVFKQSTNITVTGCKARTAKKARTSVREGGRKR